MVHLGGVNAQQDFFVPLERPIRSPAVLAVTTRMSFELHARNAKLDSIVPVKVTLTIATFRVECARVLLRIHNTLAIFAADALMSHRTDVLMSHHLHR